MASCRTLGNVFLYKSFCANYLKNMVDFSSDIFSLLSACVLIGHLLYMLLIQLELFVIPGAVNRKHKLSYINKCKCLHPVATP